MIDDAFKLTLDVLYPAPNREAEARTQTFSVDNYPDN
jgi:hypothetical protein